MRRWLLVGLGLSIALIGASRLSADWSRPILAAPALGVLPVATAGVEPETPPTAAGQAIVTELDEIARTTTSSRYTHRTDVDVAAGRYHWDCSGMVGWLLRRHAPAAFRALGRARPVAADLSATIARAPGAPGGPWQRIADVRDVRAGDVFAWRAPPAFRGAGSTGHTGIVLSTPQRIVSASSVYAVRIADSTTMPHELDSRIAAGDTDGGLGTGVMTFVVDDAGSATHYGWWGALSPLYVEAPVVFGRVGS